MQLIYRFFRSFRPLRTFITACSLAAVTVSAQPTDIHVMKVGTATLNDLQHEWYKRFAADVAQRTGGKVRVEIYPAGQLGAIPRMIEGVQFGTIQAWNGPPQFLAGIDSRFNVLSAPGVFKDAAHGNRVLQDNEFNQAFLALGANKGVRGIGLFVTGPAGFAMRTPTQKLADLERKKIRVLAADMDREQLRKLKASPVPMALGEVLPALQQGALDGVMSVLPVLSALRYYDAAKYFYETEQAMVTIITVVSKSWMDKLPSDLQAAVLESGKKTSREIFQWSVDDYAKSKQDWTKGGGQLVTISQTDRETLTKMMASIGAEVAAKTPADKAIFDLMVKAAERTK